MATSDLGRLKPFADDVYTASSPQTLFGIHLGTRMTVVRLPDGTLWLHSPVPLSPALKSEIDALGEVAHIVCPNLYHHLHAGAYAEAYPRAVLHGPRGLGKKRRDLAVGRELSEEPDPDWGGALSPLRIRGTMIRETMFLHEPSRTLITSDLLENFPSPPAHLPTRIYLKAAGLSGRPGWSRFLRFLYRDRPTARQDIERLLERDFDRLVVAHGEPVTARPKEAVRGAMTWLLG